MAIRVALTHTSRYRYDREVVLQPHVVRLRPAPHSRTPIVSYSIRVMPEENFLNWQQDPFGNYQARLAFNKPARELFVEVDLVAEMIALNPFDFFVEEAAENYPIHYEAQLGRELAPYLAKEAPDARFGALIEEVHGKYARAGRRNIDVLVDINRDISQRLRYDLRMEPGVFTPEETLVRGHGSCRDFAWLEVELLRRLGFAARFVSGYSIQLKPDVKPLDGGPAGVAEDVADLHAWAEVYLPGAGWIALDPTSGLLRRRGAHPAGRHRLALDRGGRSAARSPSTRKSRGRQGRPKRRPSRCACSGSPRRRGSPSPTAKTSGGRSTPSARASTRICRSTTSGSPWAASRPSSRSTTATRRSGTSPRSARGSASWPTSSCAGCGRASPPGGSCTTGRASGTRASRSRAGPTPATSAATASRSGATPSSSPRRTRARRREPRHDAAQGFVTALAERLGLGDEFAAADVRGRLLLPVARAAAARRTSTCSRASSRIPIERARLARVFDAGLGEVAGYVLPLRARTIDAGADRSILWESGRWTTRDGHLFLLPGDSPMGYRLPLDGLPWEAEGTQQQIHERDPLAARPPLGPVHPPRATETSATRGRSSAPPSGDRRGRARGPRQASPDSIVRTALCVEPREGMLHVFMPPVELLEEYLALVAAVEDVARARAQPVRIEGYAPPGDYRSTSSRSRPIPASSR